jgi:hypothetical protein
MNWQKILDGVPGAVLASVALGVLGLIWNWASAGGLVRALGGVTQAELADLLPFKLSQYVSQDTSPEAFAQCNSDETPVAGECVVIEGAGQLVNAGIQLNRDRPGLDGYHCLYAGSPKVRAYVYCAHKKQIKIIQIGERP